jgi:hypothetical protein
MNIERALIQIFVRCVFQASNTLFIELQEDKHTKIISYNIQLKQVWFTLFKLERGQHPKIEEIRI